jgi:hypothetical protein
MFFVCGTRAVWTMRPRVEKPETWAADRFEKHISFREQAFPRYAQACANMLSGYTLTREKSGVAWIRYDSRFKSSSSGYLFSPSELLLVSTRIAYF